MRRNFTMDLFTINKLDDIKSKKTINLLLKCKSVLTTFNQIMTHFEETESDKNGILFVCNEDYENQIIFHHLFLFCEHYKISLYGLAKSSRFVIEKHTNMKYVSVYFVMEKDLLYKEILKNV